MADAEKVKQQYADSKHLQYHESQFKQCKRSTVALCDFVSGTVPSTEESYTAIDVCCGGCGNMFHLSKTLPRTTWVGVDSTDKFFSLARKYLPDGTRHNLVKGDVYKLSEMFAPGSFDIAFSIQTLTWLPRYEDVMREIIGVTKKWIFITSLFSDFNVDVFSEVYEYKEDWVATDDSPYNYNVYSFARFRDFCISCGAKEVIGRDFVIDIDLIAPANKLMGTYTVDSRNGTRFQFSGPVFMPWKMIAVRLG